MPRAPLLALLLLPLAASLAQAKTAKVEVKLLSVRGDRVYLQLETARGLEQATLRAGQQVVIRLADGRKVKVKLIAVSSKYMVVGKDRRLAGAGGQRLVVRGRLGEAPDRTVTKAGQPKTGAAPIQIGRASPSVTDFRAQPEPERELVPFRGRAPEAPETKVEERKYKKEVGQDGEVKITDEDGNRLTPSGLKANDVKGDVVVGVRGVYDDEAGVSRTTPYARVRVEVRQLGGSDRMRFGFYGAIEHPFNGSRDWTGNNKEQLRARFTELVFEIETEKPDRIQSFSDRLELSIGRSTVPAVLEAGIVDGIRVGIRAGPVVFFGFGGLAASLNPRRSDFDSLIGGGGARFATRFGQKGALKLSLALAHERFRGEGERDFFETQGAFRWGPFGANGMLVGDLYDSYRDDEDFRITTAMLNLHYQVTRAIRVEGGYRERRPQYQLRLLNKDLDPRVLGRKLDPNDAGEPDPLPPFLNRKSARRNMWAGVRLRLPARWVVYARAQHYQGRKTRDTTGGTLGVSWRPKPKHSIAFQLSVLHRRRGVSSPDHTTDPFALFTYTYSGESLLLLLSLAYRDSIPQKVHDRRLSARLQLEYAFGKSGFSLRGHTQADVRRDKVDDGLATYLGLAARYKF